MMQSSNSLIKQNNDKQQLNQVEISTLKLNYQIQVADKNQQSLLPFSKKKKVKLLNNVTTRFKSREITAIMGQSGSGKTTLLNAISHRIDSKKMNGQILANGRQYDIDEFGQFGNYVTQNDILFQTMTVKETLNFGADLKLRQSQEIKNQIIMKLSQDLKLEKCLDTLVGGSTIKGISGGQKKRTSIAFQLLSDPKVFLLDQPTSGLDSFTAYIIVKYLRKLSITKCKTIVMSIHQPNNDIFNLIDNLILMFNGNIVYQGPSKEAVNYFGGLGWKCSQFTNPPEYFISLIHPKSKMASNIIPILLAAYQQKIEPNILFQIQNGEKGAIQPRQIQMPFTVIIKTLLKRDLINITRNPIILKARFINVIFLSLFVGGLFFNARNLFEAGKQNFLSAGYRSLIGALFGFSFFSFITAMSPISLTFPIEREVFNKERSARLYNVGAYFLSRNITQIPYLVIIPLIQSLIMYWMVGLSSVAQKWLIFYLILVLIAFSGASMGLLLGSIISDSKLVSVFQPMIILPMLSFSGFGKNRADFPTWIGWIQYLIPNKYGFVALVQNQLQNSSFIEQLSFGLQLWKAIGILFALSICYRILSLIFLTILKQKIQ